MRINIRGNDVTPEKIAAALSSCERKYGLKIKGATVYVRFENAMGQTVEPLKDGEEFSRDFAFWKPKEKKTVPATPEQPLLEGQEGILDSISAKEMIEICKNVVPRSLSNAEMTVLIELANAMKVDRKIFEECVDRTMINNGYFSTVYLKTLFQQRCK